MNNVGIDIGKYHHSAAAVAMDSTVVMKPWCFANSSDAFNELTGRLEELGGRDQVRIGMEATGHYWITLYDYLAEDGWQVDAFNPLISAAAARGDVRGRKSDALDAIVAANVVRDGKYSCVTASEPRLDELKILSRQRDYLGKQMGRAKTRMGALLDVIHPTLAGYFTHIACPTALAVLDICPDAKTLASIHLRTLTSTIHKASRGQKGRSFAIALRDAARKGLSANRNDPGRCIALQSVIKEIRFLEQQIAELGDHIAHCYAQVDSPIDSIPGIGPATGPCILSEIGNIRRFAGKRPANKILAYAGGDARIRTSGQWRGKVKMTKRGSRPLRKALFLAANTARLYDPGLRVVYDRQRQKGKPHKVAISHVMRKMVTIIYAVMRDKKPYDPEKMMKDMGQTDA